MWDDIWKQQLEKVLKNGTVVTKNDEKRTYIELIGHQFTLENPRDRLLSDDTKSMNIFQCVGQFLWTTQGNFNLPPIQYYQPIAKNYSSDGVRMIGAYGPRLFGIGHLNQMEHILNMFEKDDTKRKAVASIYLPQFDQHEKEHEEVPCTLNLQYLIRDGKLHAVTYMRSQDAYNILPYDVFLFTMLQEYVVAYLQAAHEIELGSYHHFSGSFHVYKKDKTNIESIIKNKSNSKVIMEKMPFEDVQRKINQLNEFEASLRNTVIMYKKKKLKVDFDLFYGTIEESFSEKYWKQLALILLCYGTLKMNDDSFKKFNGMLEPLYQHYIQLFLSKVKGEII